MAHGGQKQGLGLAGFIGREPCLLHQIGVIHMPGDVIETAQHHIPALVAGECETGLQITPGHFKLDLTRLAFGIITLQQGNQFRCALPLLRALVLQQYDAGCTLYHAQANGRVIEHDPIELFTFSQGLAGALSRLDDPHPIPAVDAPANQDEQPKQARRAHQGPFRIAKEVLIRDGIQADPGVGPA